jgi:hypothetical protein
VFLKKRKEKFCSYCCGTRASWQNCQLDARCKRLRITGSEERDIQDVETEESVARFKGTECEQCDIGLLKLYNWLTPKHLLMLSCDVTCLPDALL